MVSRSCRTGPSPPALPTCAPPATNHGPPRSTSGSAVPRAAAPCCATSSPRPSPSRRAARARRDHGPGRPVRRRATFLVRLCPIPNALVALALARQDDVELHGYEIIKRTGRNAPTIYRLLADGWVTRRWETEEPVPGKIRRRFYRLTDEGAAGALAVTEQRRPDALRPADRTARPGWGPGTIFPSLGSR
ncbi:PadR family transcriptional regulator [Actinomadura sp. NTSP31]|uniref:PadR family transcriptional regulator n=1 Tax=Actinomadura sp. NTSP31 TaxID=1735447 RepID=UPI0035BEC39A